VADELRAARVAIVRDSAATAPPPPAPGGKGPLARAALEPLEVATSLEDRANLEPVAKGLATVVKAFVVEGDEVDAAASLVAQASSLPVVLGAQAARIRELAAALAALAHAEAKAREELDASPAGPVRLGLEDAAAKALAPLLSAAGVSAAQVVDLTLPRRWPRRRRGSPGARPPALGAKPPAKPVDVAVRIGAKRAEAPKSEKTEKDEDEAPRVELGGDEARGLVLPALVRAAVDHGRGRLDDAGLVAVAKALAGLAQQGALPEADDPRLLVTLAPAAARAQEETARRAAPKPGAPKGAPRADAAAPALDDAALAAYGQALRDLRLAAAARPAPGPRRSRAARRAGWSSPTATTRASWRAARAARRRGARHAVAPGRPVPARDPRQGAGRLAQGDPGDRPGARQAARAVRPGAPGRELLGTRGDHRRRGRRASSRSRWSSRPWPMRAGRGRRGAPLGRARRGARAPRPRRGELLAPARARSAGCAGAHVVGVAGRTAPRRRRHRRLVRPDLRGGRGRRARRRRVAGADASSASSRAWRCVAFSTLRRPKGDPGVQRLSLARDLAPRPRARP
jgi:hypothetical protein